MKERNKMTQQLIDMTQLLQIEDPISHDNLTLVPIKGHSPELEYVLGAEAIADGTLTV